MLAPDGRYSDIKGQEVDVKDFQRRAEEWSVESLKRLLQGRAYVVYLFVDLNQLSLRDVVTAIIRIRSGWNPKKRAIFILSFGRCTTEAE
jgi:hypothetical protein